MVTLRSYKDYNFTKDIFFRFASHFKVLSIDQLHNNSQLLNYHKTLLERNPELTAYAYQFAFEAVYEKRYVSHQDLTAAFGFKFTVHDPYGLNDGLCSMADANSAFIVNHLQKNSSPFKDCSFTVLATPLEYKTPLYYNIQSRSPQIFNNNRLLTDNTNPDLRIDGIPFDIKFWSQHKSTKYNHIYPVLSEEFEFVVENHFKNVFRELKSKYINNTNLIIDNTINKLENIINTKNLSWEQKNLAWHCYIQQNLSRMPPDFSTPLLIKLTNYPYINRTLKYLTEKIHITYDVLDNKYKAQQAISGITRLYGHDVVTKASNSTFGIVSTDMYTSETVELD